MKKLSLSYECREQLAAWLRAHCPCAFDDPEREFYRGLLVICNEEVLRALARARDQAIDRLKPSDQ
jgi:hypothetical protein